MLRTDSNKVYAGEMLIMSDGSEAREFGLGRSAAVSRLAGREMVKSVKRRTQRVTVGFGNTPWGLGAACAGGSVLGKEVLGVGCML